MPLARPATQYELYLCALATFASGPEHIETVQRVFRDLFGGAGGARDGQTGRRHRTCPARRSGQAWTTCWPRPRGLRRSTRLPGPRSRRRPVLTARTG